MQILQNMLFHSYKNIKKETIIQIASFLTLLKVFLKKTFLSNGEKISSLFDELFLIDYELKKAWCSGLHSVFFKEVVD